MLIDKGPKSEIREIQGRREVMKGVSFQLQKIQIRKGVKK
jgi:hypothetical protein